MIRAASPCWGSDLYFPAGSVDSPHHAPQYWKRKETNTRLVAFGNLLLSSGNDLQILTVEVGVSALKGQTVFRGDVLVREQMRAPQKDRALSVETLQPQVLKDSVDA